jgi:hypothetical protein
MQPNARGQLEDGGCVYTNTPCPNCSVSHNFFVGDPTVYGCIYHVRTSPFPSVMGLLERMQNRHAVCCHV